LHQHRDSAANSPYVTQQSTMMTAALKGFKMTLNNFTTKTLFTEWKSTWVLGCLQAMIH